MIPFQIQMRKISILGCGWLGLPLAKTLLEKGFSINGSTTSPDKISVLREAGINPFLLAVNSGNIEGEIISFLKDCEILIIDIPPKLRGENAESFIEKMEILLPFIEQSDVQKVIFISSTSVYSDDNAIISEDSIAKPDSQNGIQLHSAENLLRQNTAFQTTVIRFGGLIGDDRHPVKYLAGKKNIENPEVPVNLIHQKDCIGIILEIIQKESWNETYNAVAPFHPTRKEYYEQKATEFHLASPEFEASNSQKGKIISSAKVENLLGYSFFYPNL